MQTSTIDAPVTTLGVEFFAVVPRSVSRDTRLSDAAVRLFVVLDDRQTTASQIRVLRQTLAAELGWSIPKVSRTIHELQQAGYLVTKATGRSSSYQVKNAVRTRQVEKTIAKLEQQFEPARPTKPERPAEPKQVSRNGQVSDGVHPLSALLSDERGQALDLTTAGSRRAVQTAQGRGWTLEQIAAELSQVNLSTAQNAGAVMYQRLRALSTEPSPAARREEKQRQELEERQRQRDILDGKLTCQHGEPRGPKCCALCRLADPGEMVTKVNIAQASTDGILATVGAAA